MLNCCHKWIYIPAHSAVSTFAFSTCYKMELGVVVLGSPRTVLALFTLARFLLLVKNAPFLCNPTLGSRFLLNLNGSLLSKAAAFQLNQGHVSRPCQVSHPRLDVNGEGGVFLGGWGVYMRSHSLFLHSITVLINQHCN